MASTILSPNDVIQSFVEFANERLPEAYVHAKDARQFDRVIDLPVYYPETDAGKNADVLQEIEDEWNRQHEDAGFHVSITPSGVSP